MRKLLLTFAASLAFCASALASQCPVDMGKIDAAMETAQLSEADMATVKELRAKGEELHTAGDHANSVSTLAEAKAILGIE